MQGLFGDEEEDVLPSRPTASGGLFGDDDDDDDSFGLFSDKKKTPVAAEAKTQTKQTPAGKADSPGLFGDQGDEDEGG